MHCFVSSAPVTSSLDASRRSWSDNTRQPSVLKMVAYQVESDLVRRLAPHYHRADDEGRTLVQTALAAPADIQIKDGLLHVTLVSLSSAHRDRAIAALCEELNSADACFPGTRLRLRHAVASDVMPHADRTN